MGKHVENRHADTYNDARDIVIDMLDEGADGVQVHPRGDHYEVEGYFRAPIACKKG